MDDLISRAEAINVIKKMHDASWNNWKEHLISPNVAIDMIKELPSIEPQTSTITIGRSKGEVTMWYECDNCSEPVDFKDNYCRNCGRRLLKDG